MLRHGTINGSGGINRTSFGHCLVAVGNIKGIAGRGNLALVEISFVPKEIWRLDIVVADSHISFQTFIEMKCIYIFCADRIIGYGNGGTLGKLNSRTISITLFGYPAQVFDCIVLNRSFSGFLINIDSTGIVGNNIIADIDGQRFSCAALQMHSISICRSGTVEDVVRESNIAPDIVIMVDFNAFELAIINLKVNALEEFLCGIQTIGCGARNGQVFERNGCCGFLPPPLIGKCDIGIYSQGIAVSSGRTNKLEVNQVAVVGQIVGGLSAHSQQIFARRFIVSDITGNGVGKCRFSIGNIRKHRIKCFCICRSFLAKAKRCNGGFDSSVCLCK